MRRIHFALPGKIKYINDVIPTCLDLSLDWSGWETFRRGLDNKCFRLCGPEDFSSTLLWYEMSECKPCGCFGQTLRKQVAERI